MKNLFQRADDALEALLFDGVLKTRGRALLAAALVAGVAWSAGGPGSAAGDLAATQDRVKQFLTDRPWLDDIPINPTPKNPCHAYFFMKEDRQGVYVTFKSRYRQEIELFFYRLRGTDQIEIYLPETKKKAVGKIQIGDASKGQFDLKLSLGADPKGDGEYYSFKDWDPGSAGFEDDVLRLRETAARLRGTTAGPGSDS